MHHEHDGHCCGAEAHIPHETLAVHAGSLCCQGMCSHPEHRPGAQLLVDQLRAQLEALNDEDDEIDPATGKKRRRKVGTVALNLVHSTA